MALHQTKLRSNVLARKPRSVSKALLSWNDMTLAA
jgi:hypothetical protein